MAVTNVNKEGGLSAEHRLKKVKGRDQLRKVGGGALVALALVVFFTLPTLWFALRSYGSFELLRSAYLAATPRTSSIRGWMTLSYVLALTASTRWP